MSSANDENVDPPDKNINANDDTTDQFSTPSSSKVKNSRRRDSDSETINNQPDMKKSRSLTSLCNISLTLNRKSILDRNPFALLDTDENTTDLAGKESVNMNVNQFKRTTHSNMSTTNQRKQRIPPITITKAFKNPKEAISNMQSMIKGKANFKILKEGYIVSTESLEDHSTFKEFLAKQHLPFYTYTTSDKKPLRMVLKGVHRTYTPEEIVSDLKSQNVVALSVQPMFGKGKEKMDMFIVNFEQGTRINELTKAIKHVCHQCISWHQFVKKDIGTQCRKCQRPGHAASNCGLEYRCVKCPHRHSPGDCPLENDQPATCVNCNGNHPASYRKCPVYVKYAEKLKKKPGKSGKSQSVTIKPNAILPSNSTFVKSNVSYSQVLKSNNGSEEGGTSFNFMINEINSLFDCSLSELMQKIKSFVPEYKKVSDVMLKKVMIIDFLSQFT